MAIHGDGDVDFALSIFAFRDAADVEFVQFGAQVHNAFHSAEDGIDGSVAGGCIRDRFVFFALHFECGSGDGAGSGGGVEAFEFPAVGGVSESVFDECSDIGIVDFLFAVCESDEVIEGALESVIVEVEAELCDAVAKGVATAVFTEHEVLADVADVFGAHDFVGGAFLEDAVLVDAGFVSKRVLANDGLVALDFHAGDGGDEVAGGIEFLGDDSGANFVVVSACANGHDDFFECSVAGAFTESVDCAFDLPGTGFDCGEAIGDGKSEVVVAVGADDGAGDIGDVLFEV
ncbi:MAG: hypothetical protein RLZZ458_3086 [Planctomycetota bacterium]